MIVSLLGIIKGGK